MQFLNGLRTALARGFRVLWPTCRQASRLQSEALDHRLSWPQRFGLGLHLLVCRWCRRYGRQLRFICRAARHAGDHEHEPGPEPAQGAPALSPEARDRLRQALRQEGESGR